MKPSLPMILEQYLDVMDDIGLDAFVDIFSKLIDRLEGDIVPYAKDLLTKLLISFNQLQQFVEGYMQQYPKEFIEADYTPQEFLDAVKQIESNEDNKDRLDNRTEEQSKEDFERFGEKVSSAVQCLKTIHTVIFAASALPPLLASLEEMIRPIIMNFFKKHFFYQHYTDEILEIIQTLVHYSEPPSEFVWHLCEDVLQAFGVFWPTKFNETAQICCAFLEASKKFELPLDKFMQIDMIDSMVTILIVLLNDNEVDPLYVLCFCFLLGLKVIFECVCLFVCFFLCVCVL